MADEKFSNFLTEIIDADLAEGVAEHRVELAVEQFEQIFTGNRDGAVGRTVAIGARSVRSSSAIQISVAASAIFSPTASCRNTLNASNPSTFASFRSGTATVLTVSPGAKTSVVVL